MDKIIVIERPDSISWEEIRQSLLEAHKANLQHGLVVRSTMLSADQLREQVADGKCYVALDGDKLVGVAAVRIKSCNRWYCNGKVAHFLLDSVSTSYQGQGIYTLLQKKRYSFVEENSISVITTNTATNNKRMVRMLPKHGFHRAVMFHARETDHFSITWVKWLSDRPSWFVRLLHYSESVVKSRIQFAICQSFNLNR